MSAARPMEPTSPRQTALALLTIACDDGNYGEPLGELVNATLGESIRETGDIVKGVQHVVEVMAHLTFVASLLARQVAGMADAPVEFIVAPFAADAATETPET